MSLEKPNQPNVIDDRLSNLRQAMDGIFRESSMDSQDDSPSSMDNPIPGLHIRLWMVYSRLTGSDSNSLKGNWQIDVNRLSQLMLPVTTVSHVAWDPVAMAVYGGACVYNCHLFSFCIGAF